MSMWREFIEYVVLQRLSNPVAVDVMYEYFVNNLSPTAIASKYGGRGITRSAVRGYIQRLYEKSSFMYQLVPHMLRRIAPMLQGIEPVIERLEEYGTSRCKICGTIISGYPEANVIHVRRRHKDIIDRHVERIMNGLNGKRLETAQQ